MAERQSLATSAGLHTELDRLLINRHNDAEAGVKLTRIERTHAQDHPIRSGCLQTLIHKPETTISVEQVRQPHTGGHMSFVSAAGGKRGWGQVMGVCKIQRVELVRLVLQKAVERLSVA